MMFQIENNTDHTAACNSAIMLITDGSPYYYSHVFDAYNKNKKVKNL